ncbi:MAG: hypothetical protein EBW49_02585 [Betaproteobacteria bacterium]|nr:hypothetical protein [Betaproteobacteria bacterium]
MKFISIISMPFIGFLIIVFSRFVAEQFRALASIANYMKQNGWQEGQPWAVLANYALRLRDRDTVGLDPGTQHARAQRHHGRTVGPVLLQRPGGGGVRLVPDLHVGAAPFNLHATLSVLVTMQACGKDCSNAIRCKP